VDPGLTAAAAVALTDCRVALVLTMNGMICCMVKTENRRRHRPYTLSTPPLTKSVTLDEVPN
jgi:hypothetical protein